MARVNTSVTVACTPRRPAQLRDNPAWMLRIASTGFEERAVGGLCVFVLDRKSNSLAGEPAFNGAVAVREQRPSRAS
jgi:hypothetical protein